MNDHEKSGRDQALMVALQRGVPFVRRPWEEIARVIGMAEADVLNAGRDLFKRGIARRFGAVFDSRSMGYASTLCALDVPAADIERIAALLQPHSGITHCYERMGSPNLWFTVTAPAGSLALELGALADLVRPLKVMNLPAIQRFKVEVVLDAGTGDVDPVRREGASSKSDSAPVFSDREKSLVRRIQDNVPLSIEPFVDVALELKWNTDELLLKLADWKQAGILRRIGFILRHREAGFVANGMCVWPVAGVDVARAGRILASLPEVTHCYERPSSPSIPFNLYAMIHARERAVAEDTFRRMGEKAGLSGGRMLISVREFKKSSPVFFPEEEA